MERTLNDLKRWITSHYHAAPNQATMRSILKDYADPLHIALHSIETPSDWMRHDLRELIQSLRLPWTEIINPPPRTLTSEQMEERIRMSVRRTKDIWRDQMEQWISEFGDDGDEFVVNEADIEALRAMMEIFSKLKTLKSEEYVRRVMHRVIEAAISRWNRREERRQEKIRRRLEQIRVEAERAQMEQEAIRQAAREQGLSLGRGKRTRDPVEHGMLARRKTEK